jgi:hypothetical protein
MVSGIDSLSTTLTSSQVGGVPYSCTISAIFFTGLTTTTAASTDTQTITVFKNPTQTGIAATGGTNTNMTCSITSGTILGEKMSCSDTTHTVSLVTGDTVYVQYTETNTAPFIKDSFAMICH